MTGRQLDAVLDALGSGDVERAIAQLAAIEWQAFRSGDRRAGDLGYARWRLQSGDQYGAAATERALAQGATS